MTDWIEESTRQPEKEGYYLYKRTLDDAPSIRLFILEDGFGVQYKTALWCEIPE